MPDQGEKARESGRDIEDYWTSQRREQASGRPHGPSTVPAETPEDQLQRDPGKQVDGGPPSDIAQPPDSAGSVEVRGAPERVADGDVNFPPYLKIGKLFFTVGDDRYTGSACVIGASLLLTAAHNLYLDRAWSRRMLFVPAAVNNYGSFGDWEYDTAWVTDEWYEREPDSQDVGLVVLRNGGNDARGPRPIGDVVGYLGYYYGGSPGGHSWVDTGYPRNYGDKRYMYRQAGEYTRTLDGGDVVGMTGSMVSGISGGPWLMWSGGISEYVGGLHSFHNQRYPDEVFSPYFGRWVDEFIYRHR